jgi:exopolysaccharide biosynthesis polyprenyl glycosylphosphotransferase
MGNAKGFFIYRANVLADLCALLIALLFAAKISGYYLTGFSLRYLLEMRFSVGNLAAGLLLAALWVQIFRTRGLYAPPRSGGERAELWEIAQAALVGTVIFAAIGLFFSITLFSPLFLALLLGAVLVLDVAFRWLLKKILGFLHLGDKNRRNIVILGTNESAWSYARQLKREHGQDYCLLGFVDDLIIISESQGEHFGPLANFNALLDQYVIDEIVVAMPIRSCSGAIQDVIDQAHERGIAVRFPMSQIFSSLMRNEVWRVRQEPTLGANGEFSNDLVVYSGYELGARYLLKRLIDIAFALVALTFASPLLLLAALAIWVTSGRPVLFIQDRYGYNGRIFRLYKFRTMTQGADKQQDALRAQNERDGAAFKMKNDPRVTPLGHWLRKTSIDELPQLFNVLKGEMSMVGPRPLPLADYKRMSNFSHRRRLSVLPGITGPWQISGRDQISFEEWMQMDLDYIDNWRLLTDLKIILLTVPTVLLARGAK